ncbi:alpha/beta hydrolase [Acinetobacter nectaris]|uniref:alpha/beta hydrolase n=1 Tax=Acinetobacter nectaris TaxID=1219382 RepID=UPI001F1F0994|nr:alpha/beta fold hydrolase [Acinetobacter nectaris]MCF9045583.1 alpha/beta fold hydrolase [Acinetobacter nectaris]
MITDHSFLLEGNRTGILLIHGLTGTPNEMRGLARKFNQQGYTVYSVQLAGHCGTVEDLVETSWKDWYASVCAGAKKLKQYTDEIFVGGLSMGSLLALNYTIEHPEVKGVLCYSPTFKYDGWSVPLWGKLSAPWILPLVFHLNILRSNILHEAEPYGIYNETLRKRIVNSMNHGDSSEAGLPGNPWHSLYHMQRLSAHVRKNLHKIKAATLCLHAYEDDIAHRKNSQLIYDRVQGPKKLVWLKKSYHMITIDNDRQQVIDESLSFINTYSTVNSEEKT